MESQNKRFEFVPFTENVLRQKVVHRDGETKLGEKVKNFDNKEGAKYFLLGINEDIGPQANYGKPGSLGAFDILLDSLLNIQSNEFLLGDDICILGQINQMYSHSDVVTSRLMVEELDDFVFDLLSNNISKEGIPIVIGGGHNNAYPLIKWASTLRNQKINVVNLDPHADLRPLEGRHSGNSFSYGLHNGLINKYHVIGLHQSYNSQYILDELRRYNCMYSFFDDYAKGKSITKDLELFYESVHQTHFGLELDLDAIENMPTSAITPSGVSIQQARRYIFKMAPSPNVRYFHLPEGAPVEKLKYLTSKTLAYFVADFIKSNSKGE